MQSKSGYVQLETPNMRVLSDSQIENIHYTACEILARTGMKIENKEARELLYSYGANVNGNLVKIPVKLVERALSTAPPRVVLCDRDGNRKLFLEGKRSYFGCNPDNPEYIDPYTGGRRAFTSADGADLARLIDYLPNIDFVLNACNSADVPDEAADRVIIRQMIFNMRKTICFSCNNLETLKDIIEMGEIVAGGEDALKSNPYMLHLQSSICPLMHDDNGLAEVMLCAGKEFPLAYCSMPMGGATSPVTAAGSLAQSLAEMLTGLIVHQLTNPGAPFVFAPIISVMDMKTMRFCYGAPELFLRCAAMTDIIHSYHIPLWGTAGTVDSKAVDQQAASEMAMGYLMSALSGANLVHDTGLMDQATVTCPEILVLADEIISMVKHITQGISVNADTLALDEIQESMRTKNFLVSDHTLEHFHEIWRPNIFERTTLKTSTQTLSEKLNRKAIGIIENHIVPELAADKKQAILELEKKWLPK